MDEFVGRYSTPTVSFTHSCFFSGTVSFFLSFFCSTEVLPFLLLLPSHPSHSFTRLPIHSSLTHPSFLPPFHHLSTSFIATHSTRDHSPSYRHPPSRMISLPRSAKLAFGFLIIFCIFTFTFQLQPSLSRDRWGTQDDTNQYSRDRFPVEKTTDRPSTPLFKVLSKPFCSPSFTSPIMIL